MVQGQVNRWAKNAAARAAAAAQPMRKRRVQRKKRAPVAQKPSAPKGKKKRSGGGNNQSVMDYHHPGVVPVISRCGAAYPIRGVCRYPVTIAATSRTLVAVTNTGSAGTVMSLVFITDAGVATTTVRTIPLLATSDVSGGPTSGRAMKHKLSIVNATKNLDIAGRCWHLNGTSRLRLPASPSTMTGAQWGTVYDAIVAMPGCQDYTGGAFAGDGLEFAGHVVDAKVYEDFHEWNGTLALDDFWAHIAIWSGEEPQVRPMSTTWFLMDAPGTAQSYTFSAMATFYTRWPLDTVPGQNQTDIPVAAPSLLNRIHGAAERVSQFAQTSQGRAIGAAAMRAFTNRFGAARMGALG